MKLIWRGAVATLLVVLAACSSGGGHASTGGGGSSTGVPNTPACQSLPLSIWKKLLGGNGAFQLTTVAQARPDMCDYVSGSVDTGTGHVANVQISCGQNAAALASQSLAGPLPKGGPPQIYSGGSGGAEVYFGTGVYMGVTAPGLTTALAQQVFKEAAKRVSHC